MKRISTSALTIALAAALAACGGSGTDNAAATGNEVAAGENGAMENEMMADPNNPYAHAEMQMHERMMAAAGTDVSDTWVKKMIEHHRGAVEMANIVQQQGAQGRVLEMAQMTIAKQTKEIGELEAMAKQGAPSQESAAAYRDAGMQMHERMMGANGADASETWVSKMIEHHRGAIAMSEIVVAQRADPRVREKARKTAEDQRKEIAELERILSGEGAAPPVASAPPPPTNVAPTPAATKSAPRAPAKKVDTPKAAPKPKAPATDPMAGHDMNKM